MLEITNIYSKPALFSVALAISNGPLRVRTIPNWNSWNINFWVMHESNRERRKIDRSRPKFRGAFLFKVVRAYKGLYRSTMLKKCARPLEITRTKVDFIYSATCKYRTLTKPESCQYQTVRSVPYSLLCKKPLRKLDDRVGLGTVRYSQVSLYFK